MAYLILLIVMPILGCLLINSAANTESWIPAVIYTGSAAVLFFDWANVIGEAVTKLMGVV